MPIITHVLMNGPFTSMQVRQRASISYLLSVALALFICFFSGTNGVCKDSEGRYPYAEAKMSIESVSPSDKNSFGGVGCHLNWDLGSNIKIFPAPQEEINILGNGMTITNNDQTPSLLDHTDFGSILVCAGPITRTFTIENTGTGNLQITGIAILPSGPNPFIITTNVPNNQQIAPNSAFQFTVSFDPSNSGSYSSQITIDNSDDDEDPYSFAISGTGVADLTPPTITCPGNITNNCGPNACTALITYIAPNGNDNCPNFTTTKVSGVSSGQYVAPGVHPTVWRVTDGSGNSTTCSFVVTVIDNQIPFPICQNGTVAIGQNGSGTLSAASVDSGSTDNCSFTRSLSASTFICSQVGTTQSVTLTVTDASGNSATCTAQVSIVDNLPPSATCQNATVQLPPNGPVSITASMLENGSTDNCGSTVASINQTNLNCNNVGTNSIIVTVTDGSGNTATCTATVILEDLTPPVANCGSITATLNAQGSVTITAQDVDNGSTDNCGIDTRSVSQTTFTCSDVGANYVLLQVQDASGNSGTCTSVVWVTTSTSYPTITANTQACNYNVSCHGGADGVAHANFSSSCGGATFLWSNGDNTSTATGLAAGMHFVTVTDISGNTSTNSILITSPPAPLQVILIDTTSTCSGDSTGAATVSFQGGTNCQPATYQWNTGVNTASIGNVPAGTYLVTVTDAQGCSASMNVTISNYAVPAPTYSVNNNLLSSDQNWSTYQWFLNGAPIQFATSGTFVYLQSGNYVLQVTNGFGCVGYSPSQYLTSLGQEQLEHNMTVSPNPSSSGQFLLETKAPILSEVELQVLDIQGRQLHYEVLEQLTERHLLHTEKMSSGIYLLRVKTEGKQLTYRLIRE